MIDGFAQAAVDWLALTTLALACWMVVWVACWMVAWIASNRRRYHGRDRV